MQSSCPFPVLQSLVRGLTVVSLAFSVSAGVMNMAAQTRLSTVENKPVNNANSVLQHPGVAPVSNPSRSITMGSAQAATPAPRHLRDTTNAQRTAAAARLAARRAAAPKTGGMKARANAIVGIPGNPAGPTSLDQFYFSGVYPNYANSPLPNIADTVNCAAPNYCGMRKFVDTLPLLNRANNLHNMLPIAV